MNDFQKELLEEIKTSNARHDKMESTLATFAQHMQTMALTMERIGTVQERLEEDAKIQRAVDDKQNDRIEDLRLKYHEIDKNLTAVVKIPKNLENINNRLIELEKFQVVGESHWGKVRFLLNKLLLPVIGLLALTWAYLKDTV